MAETYYIGGIFMYGDETGEATLHSLYTNPVYLELTLALLDKSFLNSWFIYSQNRSDKNLTSDDSMIKNLEDQAILNRDWNGG